jgi:hypothetical protein
MKQYNVSKLALILGVLEGQCKDLQLGDVLDSKGITDDEQQKFAKLFRGLHDSCAEMGVDRGILRQIDVLLVEHETATADRRPSIVHARIRTVLTAIDEILESRKFFLLSEEEAGFYANGKLFGESFQSKYSISATREALCAGNCYAASQYTACVFHCMRVAEYGLRKLATNSMLRVKLTDRGKPMPIEYATWNKVITAIRNKIAKVRSRADSVKKEADLQFFSSAADHCEYMKDLWRNEISHTRRWYKKEEALAAINRVKEFVTAIGDHRSSPPADDSVAVLLSRTAAPLTLSPVSQLEAFSRLVEPPRDPTQ